MKWHQAIEQISPYVVKIESPTGHGTGFLCLYNEDKSLCGIATAYHVVRHADQWQQPLRVRHYQSGDSIFLKESERVIFSSEATDSAVVLFQSSVLDLPELPIQLLPSDRFLKVGVEVGWLGFPALEPHTLCFFSGNISARQRDRHAYLIDGVAINGVSGGPVFDINKDELRIIGTVAAYIANRATGDTLPGLAVAQDVSHFHDIALHLKSIAEATEKKESLEQQIPPPAPPTPPVPGDLPAEPVPAPNVPQDADRGDSTPQENSPPTGSGK